MTLRIGFDMDGVLADFASAFREIERDLFGGDSAGAAQNTPEEESEQATNAPAAAAPTAREIERRRRAVWDRIRSTQNFWTTLNPTEPAAVRRLHAQMLQHRWEVVFITQRPATAGDTVQRQTQRWLVQQGFELPSVVVIAGSRGAAVHALRLTHHVDDSPQNCVDVKTDSRATPILVVRSEDSSARQARSLNMGVASSIGECLDMLENLSNGPGQSIVKRLSALVNWNR
jgi:beta-phosphoglucomutase-like phosphatase (HAD superfamily)